MKPSLLFSNLVLLCIRGAASSPVPGFSVDTFFIYTSLSVLFEFLQKQITALAGAMGVKAVVSSINSSSVS